MTQKEKSSTYKIAVVVDPLYKYGGAEKHLGDILRAFPNSTLFTAFCDRDFVKKYYPNVEVKTSFMQYIPGKFKFRYFLQLIQPLAYRSFRYKGYDAILSLSIAFAKFTKGNIPHINICMSPTKFFWEKKVFPFKPYLIGVPTKTSSPSEILINIDMININGEVSIQRETESIKSRILLTILYSIIYIPL